ncbi:hypothetical protein Ping_2548 [Psychromonas ingrahamii 37]|uniref:Uncharacterized protein n=1 Tax=Psychromonas ingrahamii (strain DSM 17664 / CCUG 51855 / 37) TaxID=357804 RepID=A1SXQ4_PSYIN|nr:hypothetical protein [Psychromonas ingrahamii]ABM04269.1 hypothetical protein Ping_2548 [Psychromonas ingrahamii 37]
MTEAAATNRVELKEKISSATLNRITEAIEHDLIILTVTKALLKEEVKDGIDLENNKENPRLEQVIEYINGRGWSNLFTPSARRTAELIKAINES